MSLFNNLPHDILKLLAIYLIGRSSVQGSQLTNITVHIDDIIKFRKLNKKCHSICKDRIFLRNIGRLCLTEYEDRLPHPNKIIADILKSKDHSYLGHAAMLGYEKIIHRRDCSVLYIHLFVTAARNGHLDIIKYLDTKHLIPYSASCEPYIIESIVENNHLDVLKYLIQRHVKIDKQLNNLLLTAISRGYLDITKYLVLQGADIHVENDRPFFSAIRYNRLDIAEYLLLTGANIHTDDDHALVLARNSGKQIYEYISKKIKE